MLFDLQLPRLKLSASLAATETPNTGKWQFSLSYRFPTNTGSEGSRAIFSTEAQAITAGIVILTRAGAEQSPAIIQAIQLWSAQVAEQQNKSARP